MRTHCEPALAVTRAAARSRYLVFDVGGTTIRAALYDPDGDTVEECLRISTTSRWAEPAVSGERLLERLVDDLRRVGAALCDDPPVVAVGLPGPIDPQGRLLAAPTVIGSAPQVLDVRRTLAAVWPQASLV